MFGPHFNIVFLGGGGSILREPGFRGKYSKIKHITCIFLNIFVQDCSLATKVESYRENFCVRALKESESSWCVNTFSTVRERTNV